MSSPLARSRARAARSGFRHFDEPAPSLAHRPGVWSGVHRLLERPIEINGAAPDPLLALCGIDGSPTQWPTRQYPAVPVVLGVGGGAGAAPALVSTPCLGALDGLLSAVRYGTAAADKFHVAPNTALGNCGTGDIAIEAGIVPSVINKSLLSKYSVAATKGWQLDLLGTSKLGLVVADGSGYTYTSSAALALNAFYLVHFFLRRAGSGQCYVCGIASGAAIDISARQLTTDEAIALTIGASAGGAAGCGATVAFLTIRSLDAWLDTHLQATLAKERTALFLGSRPIISWAGETFPAAAGSTSAAHQCKVTAGVTRLHLMGGGAPRFERVLDADGREFVGALVEPGATNPCTYNTNVGGTPVLLMGATAGATPVAVPDGTISTTATITEDGSTGQHRFARVGCLNGGGTGRTVLHCWVAAANRGFVRLVNAGNGSTVQGCYVECDLATGACTSGVNTDAYITAASVVLATAKPLAGGWHIILVADITIAAGASHYVCCTACNAAGGYSYTGTNGLDAIRSWGIQSELGSYPTSVIITGAADAARVACALRYSLTNCLGAAQGGVRFRCLFPANFPADQPRSSLLCVGNPGATDYILLYRELGENALRHFRAPDSAGDTTGVSLLNNKIREVLVTWKAKTLDVWLDGQRFRYTMTTPPTGMTQLYIANSYGAGQAGPALVAEVKVYPRYQPSWEARGTGFQVS